MAAPARLIGVQRDRVIATYALLSATGRLDVKTLGLNTPDYSPEVHYQQVRDPWAARGHRQGSRNCWPTHCPAWSDGRRRISGPGEPYRSLID
jgi:hypothetical protein